MKKVFISYSHKDKDWVRDWLLPKLESAGVSVHIDFRDFELGIPLVLNIERAIEKCAKTLLVLSPNWINSEFAQFEALMLQTQDPLNLNKRILPLMLDQCGLPPRLKIFTYGDFRNKSQWQSQIETIIEQIKKDFSQVEERVIAFGSLSDENIHIGGLPETGYELFGRQKELKILDVAWEWVDTNVLSFVAYGGVGKTTLVNKWLERMRWDNYRGAEKVFGWSFYSQGTKERVTSADNFISEALEWFGDPDPKKGSPWDKGRRLADLVRNKKTLLILDGLEPLQSGLDFERGKIKDPALSILVTQLARKNNGLCVITTRENVVESDHFEKGVVQRNLDQISKEAGRALLRLGGVQGTDKQLEVASEAFGNHALAVNLLASYIHEIKGHHVKNASKIPDLDIPEDQGRHPRRVIEVFEKRFGKGPALQLLRILGLFDRPVEMDAIKAVYDGPPIKRLTDKLLNLTEAKWQNLLEELRGYKLLARKSTHRPDIVDCHPLVREHFGQKLQETNPEGWLEAHGRLYEYYKSLPEKLYDKFLPDTLEEMEPLFYAVSHGCQAQSYKEVLEDVYIERMQRRSQFYTTTELGAFGTDLAALSNFFKSPWFRTVPRLKAEDRAYIFTLAGFRLRACGRLREAVGSIDAGQKINVAKEDWVNILNQACNLSEIHLKMGQLERSLAIAEQNVDLANRVEEIMDRFGFAYFQRKNSYAYFAHVLHNVGSLRRAETFFNKAEEMEDNFRFLFSARGCNYCDLLLSQGRYKEVQIRASDTLKIAKRNGRLLDIACDRLSLGRACLVEAIEEQKSSTRKAYHSLNQAINGLRQSGNQDYIPRGLLARAEMYRYRRSWGKAWVDLEDAKKIAERCEINLYLADYHLEAARLCLAERGDNEYPISNTEFRIAKLKEAREHYEEAAKRVNYMGYHRRDPEVLLIQAELEIQEGKKDVAKKKLKVAEKRINEMGCHRWDVEVERLQGKL